MSGTGYAASKLVGEKIVEASIANTGANASIMRIGQLVGDTKVGWWNDTEIFPLVIRSAVTMGVLPELEGVRGVWLPVDVCAAGIVEIEGMDASSQQQPEPAETNGQKQQQGRLVHNITSPHVFSWTDDLLPALQKLGLQFDNVSMEEWLRRLRQLATPSPPAQISSPTPPPPPTAAADPTLNPALKLIDFFEDFFARGTSAGLSGDAARIVFDTSEAGRKSRSLRDVEGVLESGLLGKMMGVWMGRWTGNGEGGKGESVGVGEGGMDGEE